MPWVFASPLPVPDTLRQAVRDFYRIDESTAVARILAGADHDEATTARIAATARRLVFEARRQRHGKGGIDAFLNEFALSSRQGTALMRLPAALLRLPDPHKVDRLTREKPAHAACERHPGHSP